jgi:methylisocitrate lyase
LLSRDGIVMAAGAYDAFSAKLGEQAGFEVTYMTGSGTAATFGYPDIGLLSMNEMVANATRIADSVSLPVIADADTGYGNSLNVMRTVYEYERSGVAAIHLEDQVMPKRCGHMEDKELVPAEEMVAKLHAATESRQDRDFTIIARTDSRASEGISEALRRAELFVKAGADVIFPEALQTPEEFETFAREIPVPLLANMTEWGKSPLLSAEELQQMGYKIVIFPTAALQAAQHAMVEVLGEIRRAGTQRHVLDRMQHRQELYNLVGLDRYRELEKRFAE